MTVSADTLALLMEAGLSGQQLLAVVRSIETDNPAAPEKPVSAGALRMRNMRARRAAEAAKVTESVTCDVTRDATCDVTDVTLDPAPNKSPPDPQKLTPTPHEPPARARKATRLPQDFAVPLDWLEWAIGERGWSMADATIEASSFVDYWLAKPKDDTKRDWQATWRTWVRRSGRKPTAPVGGGSGSSGRQWTAAEREAYLARTADLDRKLGRQPEAAPPEKPPPRDRATAVGRPIGNLLQRVLPN